MKNVQVDKQRFDALAPAPQIPQVPKAQFEAVIKALLNTPPLPLADIPRKRKRKPKAKARASKQLSA